MHHSHIHSHLGIIYHTQCVYQWSHNKEDLEEIHINKGKNMLNSTQAVTQLQNQIQDPWTVRQCNPLCHWVTLFMSNSHKALRVFLPISSKQSEQIRFLFNPGPSAVKFFLTPKGPDPAHQPMTTYSMSWVRCVGKKKNRTVASQDWNWELYLT